VAAGAGAIGTGVSEVAKTATVTEVAPAAADILPIAYAIGLAILAIVLWRGSFLAKREIFLENVVDDDGSCPPTAYSAEDELFTVLRRKKPLETLLDMMLESVPIAVFAFLLWVDPLRWTKGVTFWTQIAPVMVAALYLCWWLWQARASARATARPR